MPVKPGKVESQLIEAQIVVGEDIFTIVKNFDFELDNQVNKVKDVRATIKKIKGETIFNTVIIDGILEVEVFYLDLEEKIQKKVKEVFFNHVIDIPGVEKGMNVILEPGIEQILSKLDSDNILQQKIFLQIFVKVLALENIRVKTGQGPLVKAKYILGEYSFKSKLENEVNLAMEAVEIFDIKAKAEILATKIIEDKLVVQGKIHKDLIYLADDGLEHHQDEDIPFSIAREIPTLDEGTDYQLKLEIEDLDYSLNSQKRLIHQTMIISLEVKLSEYLQINVVTGENALLLFSEVIGENIKSFKNETKLDLAQAVKEIKEINASFKDLKTSVLNDKVIVKGAINMQISYLGKDNNLYYQSTNKSFSEYIDIEGARPGMNIDIIPGISFAKPVFINGNKTIIQRAYSDIFVKVTEDIQFNVHELDL